MEKNKMENKKLKQKVNNPINLTKDNFEWIMQVLAKIQTVDPTVRKIPNDVITHLKKYCEEEEGQEL
jgi:hypothetical protein